MAEIKVNGVSLSQIQDEALLTKLVIINGCILLIDFDHGREHEFQ